MSFFERRDQIAALSLKTSPKLLLYRLHDYAGRDNQAFPGHERLAFDLDVDKRTIGRLIQDLEQPGYIVGSPRGQETIVYALQWDAIAAAGRTRPSAAPRTSKPPVPQTSESAQPRTPMPAPSPPPDAAVRSSQPDRTNSTVPTGHPCLPEHKENSTSVIKTPKADRTPVSTPRRPIQFAAPVIDPTRFASLSEGVQVIDRLMQLEKIATRDRLNALSLWQRIGRQYGEPDHGGIESPGAVFFHAVSNRTWNFADGDEDAAQQFLKAHDRRAAGQRSNGVSAQLCHQFRVDIDEDELQRMTEAPR